MPSSIPQAVPASFSLRSKNGRARKRESTPPYTEPAGSDGCPCHQMKKTGIYALAGTLYQLCQNSHRTVSSLKACMSVCQRKCIMHHPHRTACILLINQHGYTDLGGCNHFNIDIGAGQRFEHLRGNAWITGHTGSYN